MWAMLIMLIILTLSRCCLQSGSRKQHGRALLRFWIFSRHNCNQDVYHYDYSTKLSIWIVFGIVWADLSSILMTIFKLRILTEARTKIRSTSGEEPSVLETFNPPIWHGSKGIRKHRTIIPWNEMTHQFLPSQNTLLGNFAAAIMSKGSRDCHPHRQYYCQDIWHLNLLRLDHTLRWSSLWCQSCPRRKISRQRKLQKNRRASICIGLSGTHSGEYWNPTMWWLTGHEAFQRCRNLNIHKERP